MLTLFLDEYNSSFIIYELHSGFYTFKDISEVFLRNLQHENDEDDNAIDFEFDDITKKTRWVVRSGILAIRFG